MLLPLLCALGIAAGLQEPVRVTASLTATRIGVGSSTTLQVNVETSGESPEEIRIPRLAVELETLGTSDFSQMQISVPGGRSRVTRRDLVIAARRPGIYRIPPIGVRVSGRMYYTNPLELVVEAGGAPAPSAETSAGGLPRLTLWLQPDTVYVGEQVLLQADALFSDEMRLRQTRPASFDPPAPSGFWVQELPNPVTVSLRVLDGRTVEMQSFRRAYFPLSAGKFVFPPARLHYELRRGFLYAPESRQIESDSAPLIVRPLPDEDRPAGFRGAVGDFTLRAELAPRRVNLGDATTLVLELEGLGNIKALPEPQLPDLPGVEVYSPAQDSRVDVHNDRVSGIKRFRWVLVPERPGTVRIPPIEYSYFDPAERKYQVLRTDTIFIEAVPVAVTAADDTTMRPLHRAPRGARLGWANSPTFLLVQGVPLFAVLLLIMVRRRRTLPPTPKQLRARVLAELDALRRLYPDTVFLAELERVLLRGVRTVLGIDQAPAAHLRRVGVAHIAERLDVLIAELQHLRYAPAEPFERSALLREARAIINEVPLPTRRKTTTTAIVFYMIGASTLIIPRLHAGATDWQDGVAAFDAGAYIDAANQFYAHARAHPRDADAWYNHGLAAYRAGDPGRAVWAWLRALKLAPRSADIAHNLHIAGADGAAASVLPFDRLAPGERNLLAAIGWWLLLAAVTLRVVRRRHAWWLTTPALLCLLFALTATTADALRPVYVTPLRSGTDLLGAPNVRAESLGRFEPGAIARVRGRRVGYLLVAIDEVREAWVERGAVAAP